MARTLTEIYALSKECCNKRLELTEFENSSKMSIIDSITWVASACIWAFENLFDVLKVDLAKDLQNRVNGTPSYFANALLKYQSGDELVVSEDGTSFHYQNIDEKKRVIKNVSYSEFAEEGFHDKVFMLKIATGEPGNLRQIDEPEMLAIRAYLKQILFAGQHARIVSRKGDVLIPRVTVYYDGAVEAEEVYKGISEALGEFIKTIPFDGRIYTQKIVDCIRSVDHVTDVWGDIESPTGQGIYIAQYDDDNHLINKNGVEQKVGRYFVPNSGYIKESTQKDEEAELQTWREAITLKLEDDK